MKPLTKTLIQVAVFSIAMGFLETAVVIYLRELYYPEGFTFPLKQMPDRIIVTELLRELATMIMLLYIGILSGRTFNQRFAFFLISFAVWDIFYYLFLKMMINWPVTIFEWDVLFLIPAPWIGPVLAPCIISLTMILLGLMLLKQPEKRLTASDWVLLITISILYIHSFVKDQFETLKHTNKSLMEISQVYVPETYNWWLFLLPFFLFCFWCALFMRRKATTLQS